MTRAAKFALLFLGLAGLAGFAAWWWPKDRMPRRPGTAEVTAQRAPGGEGITLEIFVPGTRRILWRLSMTGVTLTADERLVAMAARADYFGTDPPATLAAERLEYTAGETRLIFRGGVRLVGPDFVLVCAELAWDDRTRSFSAGGGYVLNKGRNEMRGAKLIAGADWRNVRSIGPVRFTGVPPGGIVE